MSKALDSAKSDHIDAVKTLIFEDVAYPIIRKPNTLLIAELARTSTGEFEAIGVIAEFFEIVLGKAGYQTFKRAFYASDAADDTDVLLGLISQVIEKSTGRPTE